MTKAIIVVLITIIFCIPLVHQVILMTAQSLEKLKPEIDKNYELVYGKLPVLETDCVFVIGTSGTIKKEDAVNYGVLNSTELYTALNRVKITEDKYENICKVTKAKGIIRVKKGQTDILQPCTLVKKGVIIDD